MLFEAFHGRRVLLTGHTGFKGSWLAEWLLLLGADVTGYALPPSTEPALFEQLGLRSRLQHIEGDVRARAKISDVVAKVRPEFVFHLAAQPLVRESYISPAETYETNVMGMVNLMEAIRSAMTPCVALIATTDKCYENLEDGRAHQEDDPLGGKDPYSSSKACAELAVAAYRNSFFAGTGSRCALATARAGNVVGGGDWASHRIVPDCVRSLSEGKDICIRNPDAVRPWQHVLESLSGYLLLAARLDQAKKQKDESQLKVLSGAFNFGPEPSAQRSVENLVEEVIKHWPGHSVTRPEINAPGESHRLHLSIEKAARVLEWRPVWSFAETVERTISWYRRFDRGSSSKEVAEFTRDQIQNYGEQARALGRNWSV